MRHEFHAGGDCMLPTELVEQEFGGAAVSSSLGRRTCRDGGPPAVRTRWRAFLASGVRLPAPGWAVASDLLLHLVGLVREHRPARIVEIGSGISTCWLAWAQEEFGIAGRVVSLEHLPAFRRRTVNRLRSCGLDHRAEVRLAPLTQVRIDGATHAWYDPAAWGDLRDCDLLLVDGPPGATATMARYPAVPLLASALRPGALVVLDDYKRRDERLAVAEWQQRHPDWQLRVLDHKRGTAVLTVPAG